MSPEVHIYDASNDGSSFPSPIQEDMIKTTIVELPMTPGRPLPPKKKKKKRNYPAPPRYQRPAPPQHTRTDPFPRPTFASNITPLMSFPPPIPSSLNSPPASHNNQPPALTILTSPPCKSPITPPFYSPTETQPLLLSQPLYSEIASAAGHAEGVLLGQQIAAEQQLLLSEQLQQQRRNNNIPRIYWYLAWTIWAVFGLGVVIFWAKFWELSRAAAGRNH
ncbi:MAG: hypothetical protein M1812_006436 [Candelaria pacifica]|nr:MAG: hypothetical protein M1812_006436 [Candelaria pacifica]